MPSSRYHHSSIGSNPSRSFSMTSMDDPPPPPPPRRSKTSSKNTSSRHRGSKGTSFDASLREPSIQSNDAPQSRYEDENDSRNSREYSHTSSRSGGTRSSGKRTGNSREKEFISAVSSDFSNGSLGHNSFSAPPPPPPPPPGSPPRRSKRDGLGRIPEDDNVSRDSRSSKSSSRRSTNKSSKSREDDTERHYSSRNDLESVDTEVLQFGGDGDSTAGSTARESVAERRRKKAQSKGKTLGPASPAKKVEKKEEAKESFEDPPLELYSESDSDESDDVADKALSKKGKKNAGISRVKSLIQMGKSSPEKKKKNVSPTRSVKTTSHKKSDNKKNLSPSNRSGRKTTILRSKSPEKKKKGGFLSRFSPGRKRGGGSPERTRGREKSQKDDTGRKSPFRFRSRSRSKSRVQDDSSKKDKRQERVKRHSGEIVVDKAKLAAEHEKKTNRAPRHSLSEKDDRTRDDRTRDDRSRASGTSRQSSQGNDTKSQYSHQRSKTSTVTEKKESTFEKLRREREEKRMKDNMDAQKKDEIEDSDMEIISDEHSDDVSEMTDPTYTTKREEKRKSPVRDLEPVTEDSYASPENSPRSSKHYAKRENRIEDSYFSPEKSPTSSKHYAEREDSLAVTKSRSESPTSRSPKSRSTMKHSKLSTNEEDSFAVSKSRSESPTSRSPKSRSTKHSEVPEYSENKSATEYKEKSASEENGGDVWNPETFTDKENFVANPFEKAKPSKDPFDEPFYPSASNDEEARQMYSFVYSESDAELERGGYSKDTLTGLSFDSDDDGMNNNDGLSFATRSARSVTTEVVQNSLVANQLRSKRQMLPPGEKKVRDAFLGIDDNSGAVTLNVSPSAIQPKEQRPGMKTGSLSQRALQRPRKSRGFLEHDDDDDEPGHIGNARKNFSPQNSPVESPYSHKLDQARSGSRSPERSLSHSPSFIYGRRERKSQKQKAASERLHKKSSKDKFDLSRGKSNPVVAQDRGRRRDNIFEKSSDSNGGSRTYSPEKMKFALTNYRDGSPTKTLAGSRIRSPQQKRERTPRARDEERDSWFDKPQYSTQHLRSPASALSTQSSTRSVFKAPAVFGNSPREGSFKAPEPYNRRTDPVLSSVAHIQDPIQRAGAMILSAAAIPIQAEMRRYLAVRHREDRTWAIVVAQAYFRRWRAELHRYKYLYCVTRIQAAFRGWLVRDTMEDKHYCAKQIQKIARGYLATMSVYEDLYNITVVQSIARRNLAIKEAENRHRSIVTIQSLWRGLQCKRELNYLHWSATKIQSAWRGYTAKLNYQFDIVDIIIVQSIARRRAAIQLVRNTRREKVCNAATTIQKYWRSYDCTMNYLHCVADVLIVQSVVRRWSAIRFVKDYREALHYEMSMRIQMCVRSWLSRTRVKKQRAARDIQKAWRGFWCYSDYVFTLADIIVVQKTVRGYQARQKATVLDQSRNEKRQYDGAVMIQKTWRGYTAQMEMLFNLVHIIIVQSVVRRRIERVKFKARLMEHRAAIKIQKNWRTFLCKRDFMENYCATVIQGIVRRRQAIVLKERMLAARTIQAWYRCQATCRGYTYYISARKIQTVWRGYDGRNLANEERWVREFAAISIQKTWRRFYQYSSYAIYKHEKKAATDIQRHWRGFWNYSHFVIMRFEACKIQAVVRGVQHRKRLHQQNVAAVIIQAATRGILAKKQCHLERLFKAMVYSAQLALSQRIAARKIQGAFRSYIQRVKEKRAALVIERFFIWVRAEVEREIERRARQRIKKRQKERKSKKRDEEVLLENAYRTVNPPSRTGSNSRSKSHSELKMSLKEGANSSRRSVSARSKRLAELAVDVDDAASDVSGLTTPTITSPKFKLKSKGHHDRIDDDLEGAWREAKRKQGLKGFDSRPRTTESQKENSSTFTPNFKLSARSLSRTREKMNLAR